MVADVTGSRSDFFAELMSHQVSAREFFCADLLESLCRHSGYDNVVIFYFDTEGELLSWRNRSGIVMADPKEAYTVFKPSDIVRHAVHRDAMRDRLTYFNTSPRLYKSTDICACGYYGNSAYAHFIEGTFGGYYSANMASVSTRTSR